MNKKQDKFRELLFQKGDEALLDAKYIGVSADEIIDAYHELGLDSPITIVKSEPNPYLEKGWGNGYVRIPEGHPYYGKNYEDIPVDVHGSLTFSNHIFGKDEYFSDGYWVGFDTAHYSDTLQRWPVDRVMEETLYLFKQIYGLE